LRCGIAGSSVTLLGMFASSSSNVPLKHPPLLDHLYFLVLVVSASTEGLFETKLGAWVLHNPFDGFAHLVHFSVLPFWCPIISGNASVAFRGFAARPRGEATRLVPLVLFLSAHPACGHAKRVAFRLVPLSSSCVRTREACCLSSCSSRLILRAATRSLLPVVLFLSAHPACGHANRGRTCCPPRAFSSTLRRSSPRCELRLNLVRLLLRCRCSHQYFSTT